MVTARSQLRSPLMPILSRQKMTQETHGPECGSQPHWGTGTFSEFCLTTERERAFSVVSLWVNMLSTVYTVAVKMASRPSLPASFPCGPSIPNTVPFVTGTCPLESHHSKAPDCNTLILNFKADEEDRQMHVPGAHSGAGPAAETTQSIAIQNSQHPVLLWASGGAQTGRLGAWAVPASCRTWFDLQVRRQVTCHPWVQCHGVCAPPSTVYSS